MRLNLTDWSQAFRLLGSSPGVYTPYIEVGDEPLAGKGPLKLSDQLSPDSLDALKKMFLIMPREYLRDWYSRTIRPNIDIRLKSSPDNYSMSLETQDLYGFPSSKMPSDIDDMTWAAVIDLFNQTNANYVSTQGISPWEWERQKYHAIFQEQAARSFDALKKSVEEYNPPPVSARATDLYRRFAALPKLGDTGLNINLQNDLKLLIDQGEYDLAESIINAYDQGHASIGPVLQSPIKTDTVLPDGNILLAT